MDKTIFEYGAMSSRFSVEAENKLTAYTAMVYHFDSAAHHIALYEPEEVVKDDSWLNPTGKISARLDEIFMAASGETFDQYSQSHTKELSEAFESIKRIV